MSEPGPTDGRGGHHLWAGRRWRVDEWRGRRQPLQPRQHHLAHRGAVTGGHGRRLASVVAAAPLRGARGLEGPPVRRHPPPLYHARRRRHPRMCGRGTFGHSTQSSAPRRQVAAAAAAAATAEETTGEVAAARMPRRLAAEAVAGVAAAAPPGWVAPLALAPSPRLVRAVTPHPPAQPPRLDAGGVATAGGGGTPPPRLSRSFYATCLAPPPVAAVPRPPPHRGGQRRRGAACPSGEEGCCTLGTTVA